MISGEFEYFGCSTKCLQNQSSEKMQSCSSKKDIISDKGAERGRRHQKRLQALRRGRTTTFVFLRTTTFKTNFKSAEKRIQILRQGNFFMCLSLETTLFKTIYQ